MSHIKETSSIADVFFSVFNGKNCDSFHFDQAQWAQEAKLNSDSYLKENCWKAGISKIMRLLPALYMKELLCFENWNEYMEDTPFL